MKILFIRLRGLGDIAQVLPSLAKVANDRPHIIVDWLVDDQNVGFLNTHPQVNRVWTFPRKQWEYALKRPWRWFIAIGLIVKLIQSIHIASYDAVIDFQGESLSGWFSFFSGTNIRIGLDRSSSWGVNWLLTNRHICPKKEAKHRIERNLCLLKAINVDPDYSRPTLSCNLSDSIFIDRFITKKKLNRYDLVLLHPGSSKWGEKKRWSARNFGLLAVALSKSLNVKCMVLWGTSEEQIANDVVKYSNGSAISAPCTSNSGKLVALLSKAKVVVACDTGPLHIAAALDIPVVGIYGPTDPVIHGPFAKNSEVLFSNLACSPCVLRSCPNLNCMKKISVDDVYNAVIKMLQRSSSDGRRLVIVNDSVQ